LSLVARAGVAYDGEGDDRFGATVVLRRRDDRERQERQREDERFETPDSGSSDCNCHFDFL
jgi:hypothetical protein